MSEHEGNPKHKKFTLLDAFKLEEGKYHEDEDEEEF